MDRVRYMDVDEDRFIECYEKPNLPAVISHAQLSWPASKKWNIEVSMIVRHLPCQHFVICT